MAAGKVSRTEKLTLEAKVSEYRVEAVHVGRKILTYLVSSGNLRSKSWVGLWCDDCGLEQEEKSGWRGWRKI